MHQRGRIRPAASGIERHDREWLRCSQDPFLPYLRRDASRFRAIGISVAYPRFGYHRPAEVYSLLERGGPRRAQRRHARLLQEMLRRYAIPFEAPPDDRITITKRAILDFAYEECIDSFFGFGIFALARRGKLFIPELTDLFDVVLAEEARHITFFINWIAYERALQGRGAMALQAPATAYGYVRAVRRIVATFSPTARGPKMQAVGFGAEGAFAMFKDVTWREFLHSCLEENDKYLGRVDPALLRPRVLPTISRMLLSLPSFGRRQSAVSTS